MLQLALATILFYALHSLLAANSVKRWAAGQFGLQRWYRLLYSLISVLQVAWVAWAYTRLPNTPLLVLPTAAIAAGWLLLVAGGLLSTLAVLRFGALGFVGVLPEAQGALVRTGLHGRMRHPIYTGIIMATLGWLLLAPTAPALLVALLTWGYLPIGILLEERKLIAVHGADYRSYRREVPALLPRLG